MEIIWLIILMKYEVLRIYFIAGNIEKSHCLLNVSFNEWIPHCFTLLHLKVRAMQR